FGAALTIILLYWLIPIMGYMGAAWATLIVYATMMIFSYITGQKYYRIDYDVPRNLIYIGLALLTYFASYGIERLIKPGQVLEYAINTFLLLLFAGFVFVFEKPKLPESLN
ncbi:MAG: polysaccharide biosynthesis C-terminal domain-containing protein, partial [Bacteroidota bacterium]